MEKCTPYSTCKPQIEFREKAFGKYKLESRGQRTYCYFCKTNLRAQSFFARQVNK